MEKLSYFRRVTIVMSLMASLLLLTSCADDSFQINNEEDINQQIRSSSALEHFTQEEIDAVYTDETENIGGFIYPVSLEPIIESFLYKDATEDFKNTWGIFDVGAELKGFMNLGKGPNELLEEHLISSFESISKWKGMRDKENKPIFDDTYTINSSGSKIEDETDGYASSNGETHGAMLKIKMSGIKVKLEGEVYIEHVDENIKIRFINTKDLKVFLVGTVIKKKDFMFEITYSPYQNGWLAYGANKVKLNKMQDQIDLQFASDLMSSFYNWFKEETVQEL